MKVTKKQAAEMSQVGRTTFYRHLKEKAISVDSDGRIDVSELVRVYGNENLLTPEQLKAKKGTARAPILSIEGASEITLVEEVKRLKEALQNLSTERGRERDLLTDQIEYLKSNLKQSMDQNNVLNRLLTDQTSTHDKAAAEKITAQNEKLEAVLDTVKKLEARQSKRWWHFKK